MTIQCGLTTWLCGRFELGMYLKSMFAKLCTLNTLAGAVYVCLVESSLGVISADLDASLFLFVHRCLAG
jgi:hypothetical protein